MERYSKERKEAVIKKMMPPQNMSMSDLSEETGISEATLYNWRKEARVNGIVAPGNGKNSNKWSSENKFAVVLETATMNDFELSQYCREKGLFVEQIQAWKNACISANATQQEQTKNIKQMGKHAKKRIKELERDLRHKEKALAETAALLVLRKKANAIWGDGEDV